MSFNRGDDVFPVGYPPRSCLICGQYERGRGFRMGYAKSAHGRKHVREGTAKEIIRWGTYDYVLTDAGVPVANAVARSSDRCGQCGRVEGHAKSCSAPIIDRLQSASQKERVR